MLAQGIDWSTILADKGIAVVALFAIGLGVWKVCRFLGPLLVEFAAGHNSLMCTLEKTSLKQTEILEDHGEKLSDIRTKLNTLADDDRASRDSRADARDAKAEMRSHDAMPFVAPVPHGV